MRNWSEPKKNKAHIELIPMIDVMMFLLVFFVLISLNVIPALQQQENQTTTIIVNSDKEVAVERLIAVMDTLRQGGFFSISIATRKQ